MTASGQLDLKQRLARLSEKVRLAISAYLIRLKHQSKSGRRALSKTMREMDVGKKPSSPPSPPPSDMANLPEFEPVLLAFCRLKADFCQCFLHPAFAPCSPRNLLGRPPNPNRPFPHPLSGSTKTQKHGGHVSKEFAILNITDQELTLLRTQRQTLDHQKRGLMQRLLTGKIRVKR